ncbi:MAG TPA: hypothetical protein VH723_03685 [Candidatus Limnocylindrales bacterium]|jgi:hypothetical protein
MEIQLADQRIFALAERMPFEETRQRAMDKRSAAFVSGIGSFLQRPKNEDVVLVASQRRVEPFWHVACRARYVYDRRRTYTVTASGPEVRSLTIEGTDYEVTEAGKAARTFSLQTMEHCHDETVHEVYADGVTGQPVADGSTVIASAKAEVADPTSLAAEGTIVIPPEQRASFIVRKVIGEMMKPVQADTISEESLTLEATDLYYRPIWAFEFHWQPKDKKGVVEIDAVTGQVRPGASLVSGLTKAVNRDFLFDIGADTVGLIVPGGSIAVKVAKVALDKRS